MLKSEGPQPRDVLQNLGDAAKSIADHASTKIPDALSHGKSAAAAAATPVLQVASQVESALDAFATSIQDIEQRLPRNCTIGTRRACVRYLQNTTCFDPPLNLSSLFSSVTFESSGTSVGILDEFVSDAVAQLQPLTGRLSGVS